MTGVQTCALPICLVPLLTILATTAQIDLSVDAALLQEWDADGREARTKAYQVSRYPLIVTDAAGLDALQARISEED